MTGMHVGTASVNWGFDPLYDWTVTPAFDRLLDEMAACGYEGTEISYHFPMDVTLLRDEAARRGLRAASTFHAVDLLDPARHDGEIARAMPVAERLQALGCDVLILSDRPSPQRLKVAGRVAPDGSDGLDERQWQALTSGLNRIGEALRARGLRPLYHPHLGTYVATSAEGDRPWGLTDP